MLSGFLAAAFLVVFPSPILAANLEETITTYSKNLIFINTAIIVIVVIVTYIFKNLPELAKKILFGLIVLPTFLTTSYLAGSTIYLNQVSATKGPVHWHADFEIWSCGKQLDLVNPKGFSNKIGTNTLHEHNDLKIHVEGVVLKKDDVTLGKFFEVIGGEIGDGFIDVPTTAGLVRLEDMSECSNGDFAELQVFAFKTKGKTFSQSIVENPADYSLSPYSQVPPGDCLIIELGEYKEKTQRLCRAYKVKQQLGDLDGS